MSMEYGIVILLIKNYKLIQQVKLNLIKIPSASINFVF